jgi:hypothetical protein
VLTNRVCVICRGFWKEVENGSRRLVKPDDVPLLHYVHEALGALSDLSLRQLLDDRHRLPCPVCDKTFALSAVGSTYCRANFRIALQEVCTDHIIDGALTTKEWQKLARAGDYYNPATLLTLMWHFWACPATCTGCHRKSTYEPGTAKYRTNTPEFVRWLLQLSPDDLQLAENQAKLLAEGLVPGDFTPIKISDMPVGGTGLFRNQTYRAQDWSLKEATTGGLGAHGVHLQKRDTPGP